MQLDLGVKVGSVSDDPEKALVSAFANRDGLANQPISPKRLGHRRREHRPVRGAVELQGRVHLGQIRSTGVAGDPPTLGRHRRDIRGSSDENPGMLVLLPIVHKHKSSVQMDDLPFLALSSHLTNSILGADLGAVVVRGHRMTPFLELVGYLRRQYRPSRSILVEHLQQFAIQLDDYADGGGAIESSV